MSRHRTHHHKPISSKDSNNNSNNNSNNGSFNFGNIAQMLSSIDINQVSSLLGKINTGGQNGDVEQVNQNGYSNGVNDIDEISSKRSTSREEIIRCINILMNSDKSELLKVVMEIYGANKSKTK